MLIASGRPRITHCPSKFKYHRHQRKLTENQNGKWRPSSDPGFRDAVKRWSIRQNGKAVTRTINGTQPPTSRTLQWHCKYFMRGTQKLQGHRYG